MAAGQLPNGQQQFLDANGDPIAGGFVFMYVPFSTTPKTTWVDPTQTTANTNPIQLDAAGRCIIYGTGQYRQLVVDANGNTVWDQLTAESLFELPVNLTSDVTGILPVANGGTGDSNLGPHQVLLGEGTSPIGGAGPGNDNEMLFGHTGQDPTFDLFANSLTGIDAEVFTSSANYTVKATKLKFLVLGAGGGGGGTNGGGTTEPAGGGAGALCFAFLSGLTPGNTLAVTIGAGGPGGGTGNTGGGDGADTSVTSGTQSITNLIGGGGKGAASPSVAGAGGMATGAPPGKGVDGQGNGGGTHVGGVSTMFAPYGDGGSVALNGLVINGSTIANQDGAPGLVVIEGIYA